MVPRYGALCCTVLCCTVCLITPPHPGHCPTLLSRHIALGVVSLCLPGPAAQVNAKISKTTHLKEMNFEIEKLKQMLVATREKTGGLACACQCQCQCRAACHTSCWQVRAVALLLQAACCALAGQLLALPP